MNPNPEYATIIKEIARGIKGAKSMSITQAEWLFGDMLDGTTPELELGAILTALRIKSESPEELQGFKRAMDARCVQIALPAEPRCVVLSTCNGTRRQANLMPLLALLLARERIPVLIHGRYDFTHRHDPFALLAELGILPATDTRQAEQQLAARHIACLPVRALLPGMDNLLASRLRLGVRCCAHTLVKLLDPCPGRSVRVVAVTHPEYMKSMHDILTIDSGAAMLLRGTEGEGFANPRRRPQLETFFDGQAEIALPAEEGGTPPVPDLPDTPEAAANAVLIRAMLDGATPVPQPLLDQFDILLKLARRA